MNPKVDEFLNKATKWQEEMKALRSIVLGTSLTEGLKWGVPCYTYQNKNVVMIGGFKDSCTLSFLKGALLKDEQAVLSKPGENTQAARLIRFTHLREIGEMEPILRKYLQEAIELEMAGVPVVFKANEGLSLPEELDQKFTENPAFETAFKALSPGRQRAYVLYFSAPKQSKTRQSRIEKYLPQILSGRGIHDCTCGLSQKLPYCDGSHRQSLEHSRK